MNQKIILADNYPVFRTGFARLIAVEDDLFLSGQCDDLPRLYKAVEVSKGAVVVFASSLGASVEQLTESAKLRGVRLVAVLSTFESAVPFVRHGVQGIVYRNVSRNELIKCLRDVAAGKTHSQKPPARSAAAFETDMVGNRVRSRLSPKELGIVRLIVRGYKNKEIAKELNNSEQVVKNYLRAIFDKTGVSDRLELALYVIHHKLLAEGDAAMPIADPPGLLRRSEEA